MMKPTSFERQFVRAAYEPDASGGLTAYELEVVPLRGACALFGSGTLRLIGLGGRWTMG